MPARSVIADVRDMQIPDFDNDKALCFLFVGRIYEVYGDYLIEKLRTDYQDCKIVCIPTDLMLRHSFEPERLVKSFDSTVTFELNDVGKYNIHYIFPTYEDHNTYTYNIPEFDFYFVGNIIKVY